MVADEVWGEECYEAVVVVEGNGTSVSPPHCAYPTHLVESLKKRITGWSRKSENFSFSHEIPLIPYKFSIKIREIFKILCWIGHFCGRNENFLFVNLSK